MTNLILSILVTTNAAYVSFVAKPWIHYRLERTLVLPATNWLAADYLEPQPYHMPTVLSDVATWKAVTYRVIGL